MNLPRPQDNCPQSGPYTGHCATISFAMRDLPACGCSPTSPNIVVPTSQRLATCGDDLVAYSPSRWIGPRPAKVIDATLGGGLQVADINITFHGVRDADMLATVRRSASGNTFGGIPVYEALSEAARLCLAESGVRTWAERKPAAST